MALVCAFAFLPACHTDRNIDVSHLVAQGQYGRARVFVNDRLTQNRRDREYMLDRMQLGILTLADGYPQSAELVLEDVYEVLRTQGINADKTVASVVFNEDVKFWKGEPFEQALTFAYVAAQQGMMGQWDNTRAAAKNSLFQLKDFGTDERGERLDAEDIARRAAEYERKQAGRPAKNEDYLNSGYAVRESNFALGYLMHGIASQQLGRQQEANDYFAVALQIDPNLRPLTDRLRSGNYNTVLMVSYGLGPRKIAYGPDNALAKFVPRQHSDNAPLIVRGEGQTMSLPIVTDVNRMAQDHMWNNLEDVRKAKSVIGTGLVAAGAITTGVGAHNDSKEAVIAGIGLMAAGALLKTGAHADTRYCTVMPQRVYLVPLNITQPNTTVSVEVASHGASRMVLPGLSPPPAGEAAQLRYVRLISGGPRGGYAPSWATSGKILYSNDRTGLVEEQPVPYLLGGRDVRRPDSRVTASYNGSPLVSQMTPAEVGNLYNDEGIFLTPEDQRGYAGLHVLEGGRSLVPPMEGTAGFVRIFCQPHQPYQPRSQLVASLAGRGGPPR